MTTLARIGITSLFAACVAGQTVRSAAQDYPAKAVRIVTAAPATMMDVVSRQLALRLGERWKRPVVVENRLGASVSVSQATPDAYTLLVTDSGSLAIRPHLYRSLGYDPQKDFEPIALVASSPSLLIAHPSLPAANLREFVAYVKWQPGGVEFANAGPWTSNHLTAELFRQSTGINLIQVNYKGGGAATAAIVSGEAKAGFSVPIVSLPHVKAGRLKAYAVTSDKRSAIAPEIPTMGEAGAGNLVTTYWFGLLAPARTPPMLIERINRDAVELLQSAEMRTALLEQGAEPGAGTHQEFRSFIRNETARFKKIIDLAGFKAE
jgi:tripartite-type tricarboxylate transporter receptor subunit TctC